ncbi:MAG: hypothetical protein HWD61_15085 [Parachlamydiaceae bacterium]|nr:MAG: hypothetical protein HWD61_15085 [Parachlamydiaceae bacterium]
MGIFDLMTHHERSKPEGFNSPGVFDKTRVLPADVDYISFLSEAQRHRLQLEKYEKSLNLFMAIKTELLAP